MLRFLFFCTYFYFSLGTSEEAVKPKTMCLNMIVKNESKVIQKCLETVKNQIDYWVIVDTGSTDGTQEIIKEFMKEIPGMLYERPWVDFGHNRNEALQLAVGKSDYVFFIDADETLSLGEDFRKSDLDKDYYYAQVTRQSELIGPRIVLINGHLVGWEWQGVLHEQLFHPLGSALHFDFLKNLVILGESLEGNRSQDLRKYYKDAQVLEKALEKEPHNARYTFYVAQSYLCAKEYELSLQWYEKRASMQGREEETFWAMYLVGLLQEELKKPSEVFVSSYSKAFQFRPSRAEPLFRLAEHYFKIQNYSLGYILSKFALSLQEPVEIGFIHKHIYDYGLLFVFANCASGMEKFEEANKAYDQLILKKDLSSEFMEVVKQNIRWTKSREKGV